MDEPDGYLQQDLQEDGEGHMPIAYGGSMKGNNYGGKNRDSGCILSEDSGLGSCSQSFSHSIVSENSSMLSMQKGMENMDITKSDSTDSTNARAATDDSVTSKDAANDKILGDVCDTDSGFPEECVSERLDSIEQEYVEKDSEPSTEATNYSPSYFEIVNRCYSQDEEGDTALHIAIIHKDGEAAEKIIYLAPSSDYLNMQNSLWQSPLHLAVITDLHALVRLLVLRGATIDMRDKDGNTPLHIACTHGHMKCVRALTKQLNTEEVSSPAYTQSENDTAVPQDTNIQNYEGLTCLHVAAENTHYNIVEYLVSPKFGASVDQQDGCSGRTVLHHAVERHNIQMIVFLITRCGADINARTFDNYTSLQLAAGRRYVDVANALIRAGADKEQLYESEAESVEDDDEEMEEQT